MQDSATQNRYFGTQQDATRRYSISDRVSSKINMHSHQKNIASFMRSTLSSIICSNFTHRPRARECPIWVCIPHSRLLQLTRITWPLVQVVFTNLKFFLLSKNLNSNQFGKKIHILKLNYVPAKRIRVIFHNLRQSVINRRVRRFCVYFWVTNDFKFVEMPSTNT